jgi:predicted ATPase with chaperone activity
LFAFGEIGLSAEIRAVPQAQRRVNEAARLGLKKCVLPEMCLEGLKVPDGMKVIGVRTLGKAINAVLVRDRNRGRSESWNGDNQGKRAEDLDWAPEAATEPN